MSVTGVLLWRGEVAVRSAAESMGAYPPIFHMCAMSALVYNAHSMAARQAQRRRTRKTIVDAAARLIAAGQTPSMSDVALAADVSRRTVYLYFPTLEQLLIDRSEERCVGK